MQVKYEPWGLSKKDVELWGVKILDGKYENTIISISNLEMAGEGGEVQLEFDFINKATGLNDSDYNGDDFNKIMSFILEDILRKAIDDFKDRDSNSTKSS